VSRAMADAGPTDPDRNPATGTASGTGRPSSSPGPVGPSNGGWRHRSGRLVQAVRARITRPANVRPYLIGELLVVLFLLKLYDIVREHAEVRAGDALRSGQNLFHFERWLHIDIEPSINHWTVAHRAANYAASYWYQYAHITISMLVLGWCWYRRPWAYRRFRNALVLINLVGLTVFLLFPVAPPRLLPHGGFIDADKLVGFGSNNVGPVTADAYGAFPSLHIAWATWVVAVTYTLVRSNRLARAWVVYPFITTLAIVATGNHFVLDAIAGALLSLAALRLVGHRWERVADSGRTASTERNDKMTNRHETTPPKLKPDEMTQPE
jgi:PAP2 superfamily